MRDFIIKYGKALDTSGAVAFAVLLFWALLAGWSMPFFLFAFFGFTAFVFSRMLGSGSEFVAPVYYKILVALTATSAFCFAWWIFA